MWMKKTWDIRKKWAHVYMKWSFTTGMRSTQLSESLNAKIKKFVKFDHDIVQFFTHFDRLVMEKRDNEIDSIFDSREKLPKQKLKKSPMLIQVAQFYTPPLFDLFHDEVDLSLSCKVKQHHEFEGEFKCVIGLHGKKSLESQCGGNIEFLVSGSVKLDEFGDNICREVHCTCRKFENFGILCGHEIKGLDRMSVMEIPESYILRRWRLDAKACASKDSKVSVEEDDPKLAKAARYRNLCPKMVKLCARSCELKAAYEFVAIGVEDMCAKVDKMLLEVGDSIDEGIDQLEVNDPRFRGVNGLKKKAGVNKRKGKRLKPWYEKNGKRKKLTVTPTSLYQDVPMPYMPEMINCESNLSSQTSFHPQTFEVTGDETFLQDDEFFELISAPQQSRQN
ncbi:protein FAR1-RELATED SEQUENCE 1-like [Rhododendron vialii]|uniref:protein FAR1-RELATED SEQUENCE 1-like n=1 Tax=Rhododendron vialii TaxID=182163 RepID=UPI00265D7EE2|nr:protein FAR1-RELATED SEQUENCE 1-like [Rhododendron vialii]